MSATIALAGMAAGPSPPPHRPSSQQTTIQQTTLDNGLQVLVEANHRVPLATVLVAVRGGAMIQDPADRGLAHLCEHVLFRSFGSEPSAFDDEASYLDAQSNGATDEEVVTYHLMLPSKNAVKGIALLAKLVQKAKFSDYDLSEEKPVVLDELQRGQSDPEQVLERETSLQLWGSSWSRKDIGGDSATVRAIGLERLRETYNRYYVPNNSALIVTGDVNAAEVFAAAEEQFGRWPRARDPFADRPVPPVARLSRSVLALVVRPVEQARIVVEMQGPSVPRDSSAAYAAWALCDLLNEPGSEFQRELVGTGRFQSVGCDYVPLRHSGPLMIRAETVPDQVPAGLAVLLDELDKLDRLEGVSEEDLVIGRQRRRVEAALTLESASALAPVLASWWASGGIEMYQQYAARVNAQGLDELREFGRSYIASRPRAIGVLAPAPTIERLRALLGGGSTAPGHGP